MTRARYSYTYAKINYISYQIAWRFRETVMVTYGDSKRKIQTNFNEGDIDLS